MRELKDYFCNAEQSKELIELGFNGAVLAVYLGSNLSQIPLAYNFNQHEIKAPLRSQALDYFMELGCDFQIVRHLTKGYWFACAIKGCGYALPNFIKEYHEAKSALIDKLIELEKEARNGN